MLSLSLVLLICLLTLFLVQALPGHLHNRRTLSNGQAQKPSDVLAQGVQTVSTPTRAPTNTGVSQINQKHKQTCYNMIVFAKASKKHLRGEAPQADLSLFFRL